ncbi:hypothetical protein GGF37_005720 [Kickxella alabastrina]|nr:hypothetical protein GGF37_005720 [Kickxella alabastrina]
MLRRADAVYYGYADEDDDGELLEYERQVTERRIQKLRSAHDATLEEDGNSDSDSDSGDEPAAETDAY